jgi:hypothetical protein
MAKTHPITDIFPMLSEEELSELAEDIKANGLLHPSCLIERAGFSMGATVSEPASWQGWNPSSPPPRETPDSRDRHRRRS